MRNIARKLFYAAHKRIDYCRIRHDWFYVFGYAFIYCNIFVAIRFVLTLLRPLRKLFFRQAKPVDVKLSARIDKILFSWDYTSVYACKPDCFFTVFERFDYPDVVLSDNVTLLWIDRHYAYFAKLPLPLHEYGALSVGFLYNVHFEHALEIIRLPLDEFIALAQKLNVETRLEKAVFVLNPGRCGGTLFIQLLQVACPELLCINHQDCLLSLIDLRNEVTNAEEFASIVKATFTFMRKPYMARKIAGYGYKLCSALCKLVDLPDFSFPSDCTLVFVQRAFKPTILSWLRVLRGVCLIEFLYYRYPVFRLLLRNAVYSFPNYAIMEPSVWLCKPASVCEYVILRWVLLNKAIQSADAEHRVKFCSVRYENLLQDTQKEIQTVADAVGLHLAENLEERLRNVLMRDSQTDHSFNKKWTGQKAHRAEKEWNTTRRTEWCHALFAKYGIDDPY